jgi:hypothetical protein
MGRIGKEVLGCDDCEWTLLDRLELEMEVGGGSPQRHSGALEKVKNILCMLMNECFQGNSCGTRDARPLE